MRRLILASTLLLSACATQPPQQAVQSTSSPQTSTRELRALLGLTAQGLVGHLGNPALQIREGNSLKLQFRAQRCVLDAYLYPQGGTFKVTHVDTRTPAGARADQATCISELEQPS